MQGEYGCGQESLKSFHQRVLNYFSAKQQGLFQSQGLYRDGKQYDKKCRNNFVSAAGSDSNHLVGV